MNQAEKEGFVQVARALSGLTPVEAIGICMGMITALRAENGFQPSMDLIHKHLDMMDEYELQRASKEPWIRCECGWLMKSGDQCGNAAHDGNVAAVRSGKP